MKILFFIEAMGFGGKERRLMELIHYLKQNTNYTLEMVLTEDRVHFEKIHELEVPVRVIKRKGLKRDPRLFREFYRICINSKPDIIHTWGFMTTFYAVPVRLFLKIPLISSMITVARREFGVISLNNLFFKISCLYSDAILSNSKAGLKAFNVRSKKARVIYNGVRLERFQQVSDSVKIRDMYGIKTTYIVVMVATFSRFKDYDLFLETVSEVNRTNNDITFLAVGGGPDWERINQKIKEDRIQNVILTGRRSDVEEIIAASDIGLLCTYSEGISNSLIEYMALSKPVIVTDNSGGSKELVVEGETGYCTSRNAGELAKLIIMLCGNEDLRLLMGQKGNSRIRDYFSIDRMGVEFIDLYNSYE